jgi:hypothetical protein
MFIDNSCYFREFYILHVTSLHPKFYKRIFLWNAKSTSNYSEMLISVGIDTFTLMARRFEAISIFHHLDYLHPPSSI